MKILLPMAHGMCFGVRDALAATQQIEHPSNVTIYGELVHNESVQAALAARGFVQMAEGARELPQTDAVLITAHGISGLERGRLASAGLQILDTTCPLVRNAHAAALALAAEGRFIVVIGMEDHVEVRGLTGDIDNFIVIADARGVVNFGAGRIGVVSQTTTAPGVFAEALGMIFTKNPEADIRVMDTICKPTRDRQEGLAELLPQIDVLVVVGGKRSRNTHELAAAAANAGVAAYHIQSAADLDASWFAPDVVVGLTAGTSTQDETMHAVHAKLLEIERSMAPTPQPCVS
ncbi:MAG: 4-hydroxy-3-methylbut-2-enyl diphosphate reductase [Planctomycetes bacterium]|nr:4-hydroxy-3-methylbut-2-enyl diphosphate reductase [Planctomycetota bacterium]